MGFPQFGGGGVGTVKSVQNISPDGAGNVDLGNTFYKTSDGGPEPFTSTTVAAAATFTPTVVSGKLTVNRWEVKVLGAGVHVAQPSLTGGFMKKWYLHLFNDNVGGYGDVTFDVPGGGSLTVVGLKHSFTQVANVGEDYLFETADGLNWRMFHLTAEVVHVATTAPTNPVTGQLWANTT
jgi:hypothetical protein